MDEKKTKENEREREELVPVSIIDVLLDPDNRDPVVLMGEDGKELKFEQVAVIPHDKEGEKRLYCILHPLTPIEGIGEDEAIVFRCDFTAEGQEFLRVEEDGAGVPARGRGCGDRCRCLCEVSRHAG